MARLDPKADKTFPAKTKVSQKTIDSIKSMGMTKALKGAATGTAEYKEALNRMYGAKRVKDAAAKTPSALAGFKQSESKTVKKATPAKKDNAGTVAKKSAAATKAAATAAGKKQGAYGKKNTPKYQPATASALKKKK
jgi:hypothetical protein